MLLIRVTNHGPSTLLAWMGRHEDQHRALGRAIRGRRSELGLSRAAAARRWGVTPAWLGRLEAGTSNPSLDRLRELAEGMGISLSALFRRSEQLDDY
jgi:transcriptional regulator with XRE-family HTH domain